MNFKQLNEYFDRIYNNIITEDSYDDELDLIHLAINGDKSAIKLLRSKGYKVNKLVNPLQSFEVDTFEITDPTTGKRYNYDNTLSYYARSKMIESTSSKRISRYGEFDNGYVMHNDWTKMSDEEAEDMAKQLSLENPDDIYYVSYDNVMNPSSDVRWINGKPYNYSDVQIKYGKPFIKGSTNESLNESSDDDNIVWNVIHPAISSAVERVTGDGLDGASYDCSSDSFVCQGVVYFNNKKEASRKIKLLDSEIEAALDKIGYEDYRMYDLYEEPVPDNVPVEAYRIFIKAYSKNNYEDDWNN